MPAKYQVKITLSAELDIEEISTFIAADNVEVANRFVQQLHLQVETLERFPNRCSLLPENELLGTRYRQLLYGKYRTVLRIERKTVYVLRVIHGARLLDTSMLSSTLAWSEKKAAETLSTLLQ